MCGYMSVPLTYVLDCFLLTVHKRFGVVPHYFFLIGPLGPSHLNLFFVTDDSELDTAPHSGAPIRSRFRNESWSHCVILNWEWTGVEAGWAAVKMTDPWTVSSRVQDS